MAEPTLPERRAHAEAALAAYLDASGVGRDAPEEAVEGLIADLLHWLAADSGHESALRAARMARIHYRCERHGPPGRGRPAV